MGLSDTVHMTTPVTMIYAGSPSLIVSRVADKADNKSSVPLDG